LFAACAKENNSHIVNAGEETNATVPDNIPLTDLGTGLFKDSMGGLYPGGKMNLLVRMQTNSFLKLLLCLNRKIYQLIFYECDLMFYGLPQGRKQGI